MTNYSLTQLVQKYHELDSKLDLVIENDVARLMKATPKAKYSANKQLFGYRFKTIESMVKYLNDDYSSRLSSVESRSAYKAERKAKLASAKENVKVGDVFCASWGWEQTNVDFYQVVAKPSASTLIVREVSCDSIETCSWASDYVRPVKDAFIGKEVKVRLMGDYFKSPKYGYSATKLKDPATSKIYRSWYA